MQPIDFGLKSTKGKDSPRAEGTSGGCMKDLKKFVHGYSSTLGGKEMAARS
jgi:hypothetical protein